MNERRKRIMKRLVVEELERREMLADVLFSNALALTSLSSNTDDGESTSNGPTSSGPEAISGVGQQTITTGANTLGIGSFAMPTAGPSRAGGTGNPNLTTDDGLAALDKALEELLVEFDGSLNAEATGKAKVAQPDDAQPAASAPLMVGSKPGAPGVWNFAADESDANRASAAQAGIER